MGGGKQGNSRSKEEIRAVEGGPGATAGEVDTSLGHRWCTSTPGEEGWGGGGMALEARRFCVHVYIHAHTFAWLYVGHIKAHQSTKAFHEGLPCCPSAPAAASRL